MKKVLIITCAGLITACNCFSQSPEKVDYRQKGKNQKTAAFILLGVGVALDIGGIVATISNANKEVDNFFGLQSANEVNHGAEYALYIAGTASLLGSLPLFIAAKHNKTRAASLSFKTEMAPQLQNNMVLYKSIPSVSLKIKL